MKLPVTLLLVTLLCTGVRAQYLIRGQVQNAEGEAVAYANVALYTAADSALAKVETTDESGLFRINDVTAGTYRLSVTYLGAPELRREAFALTASLDLGVLTLAPAAVELAEARVTARRALVEVKPDRTVFNVQGTINAVGNTGLDLLRKAPGVTVDNNENINVLSRSGVLLYVDGRRLPLSGSDLSNYLRNLNAEEIDRIDIITSPGARYEAEGNAGIIDIRLKKAEDEGANGSVSFNGSQGRYARGSVNATGNYRNPWLNVFGNLGYATSDNYNRMLFQSRQNGLLLDEYVYAFNNNTGQSYRLGADFTLTDKQTLGVLIGGRYNDFRGRSFDGIDIYRLAEPAPRFDSTLVALTEQRNDRSQNTFNLNYRYVPGEDRSLNVDLDYGRFRTDNRSDQSNAYYTAAGAPLTRLFNFFDTPTDIDIYTFQADYEQPLLAGVFSAGVKLSRVRTFNTFLFYEVVLDAVPERLLDDRRSNQFDYSENVYAGYVSQQGSLTERWKYSAGLRVEVTDATGTLTPFRADLQEPPVELNYVSLFPSAGLTYALDARAGNTINLAYGRRINRPDYNVLNPFRRQLSQLSYERGNPFLSPEIVDNLELGYTHAYRYNFKLAYSHTANQVTRLLGPDDVDPRAGYVSWDNLASQRVYSLNVSAPVQVTERWNVYLNASASHLYNRADYGDGATIDLQAWSYGFYLQNTLNLPWDLVAEVGGYFSGPGVWGGVFRYRELGALNVGLQRKFWKEQLTVKVSGNDLFYTSGWTGKSEFDGLSSSGSGSWDSRRVALSVTYSFGNERVKSRRRQTGLQEAADRVGE